MTGTSQSAKLRLRVEGMDCASCATKIENALQRMPGVGDVAVSVTGGTVTVNHDANSVGEDKIRNQIADLGYRGGSAGACAKRYPWRRQGRIAPRQREAFSR